MHVGWGEGFACFGHLGDEACGELDAGEKRAGGGALNTAFAHGLKDDVDGLEGRGPVDYERKVDWFHLGFIGGFGWELRVVMTAVFGSVDCGCVAALAVFESLKAAT